MNRLFGAQKKPKEEPINPNAPSLTETSTKVSNHHSLKSFSSMKEAKSSKQKLTSATKN